MLRQLLTALLLLVPLALQASPLVTPAWLKAQGRPLPAATLWQQIRKAGVPRYRPLHITADDAGDAAAGLFLLELMGMRELSVR